MEENNVIVNIDLQTTNDYLRDIKNQNYDILTQVSSGSAIQSDITSIKDSLHHIDITITMIACIVIFHVVNQFIKTKGGIR